MVDRTAKYDGLALITEKMDHNNFTVTNADNLEYIPSPDGGYAQLRIDAEGGDYPLWKSIEYMATMQQTGGYYTNMLSAGLANGTTAWGVHNGTSYTNVVASNVSDGSETGSISGLANTSVTTASSTADKHQGSRSILQTSQALTGGDNYSCIGTNGGSMNGHTAGVTYTYTAWINVPSGQGTPTHTRGLRIVAFDRIGSGTYNEHQSNQATSGGGWTKLTVTFSLPAGTTECMVRLYSGYAVAGKTAYWDEIQGTATSSAVTWIQGGTSSNTVITSTSTTWAHSGTYSAKVTTQGYVINEGEYALATDAPVAGSDYSGSVWVYSPDGYDIEVVMYDNIGTLVTTTVTGTSTAQYVSITGTANTGATLIKLGVRWQGSTKRAGTIYADEAMINLGPEYPWIAGGTTENWAPDLEMYTELYGVNEAGNIEFIGEILDSVDHTVSTTATTYNNMFDLLGSACRSKFIKLSTAGTTGKIYLNIPMRTQYFDHFNLEILTYTGWTKYKTVHVTGQDGGGISNQMQEVTIPYDSDMASDYSDLIVTNSSDSATVPFCIIRSVAGSSVTIGIQLPTGPADGASQYYHVWYKKPGATSAASAASSLYTYFDDFEDNKLTSRTSPYKDWTNDLATAMTITSSSVFSGSYSAQIYTPSAVQSCNTINETSTSYSVDYDYKVKSRGSGASAPWHSFYLRYQDANYWARIDFYYSATYSKQYCRLQNKNGAGTEATVDARVVGSRWITGDTAKIHIADTGSHVYVYVNDYIVLSTDYTNSGTQTKKGFGGYSSGDYAVFDNLRISPLLQQAATATVGSENDGQYGGTETTSETVSDTLVDDTKLVTFTTPTLTSASTGYIEYQEKGKGEINSDTLTITDGMRINQGYNSLDAYKSLILKFNVKGEYYSVSIDKVTARYEV